MLKLEDIYVKYGAFNALDGVNCTIEKQDFINSTVIHFKKYICAEILAEDLGFEQDLPQGIETDVDEIPLKILVTKKA